MIRSVRLAVVTAAAISLNAAPALATRYASPTGSDTASCATVAHACSLRTAIQGHGSNHPSTGEDVVVGSGTYDIATPILPGGVNLHVDGVRDVNGDAPVLTWSGSGNAGVAIDASSDPISLSDLHFASLQADPPAPATGSTAVVDSGGTLDRLSFADAAVPSAGFICACTGGVLRDSVIYNWAAPGGVGIVGYRGHGLANETTGAPITEDLRNDTIVSDDATVPAIYLETTGNDTRASVTFAAENVLAEAIDRQTQQPFAAGLGAKLERADPSGTETLSLTNSDVIGQVAQGGATINAISGNIGAPALLKNFPADLEEMATSPTVDAGIDDPLNGPLDVDGRSRIAGAHTDIGAYESTPPPLTVEQSPGVTLNPPGGAPSLIGKPKLKLYAEPVILDGVTRDGSIYARCTGVTVNCVVNGKLRATLPGHHSVSTVGSISATIKPNRKRSLNITVTASEYLVVYHSSGLHRNVSASITTTAGVAKTTQTFTIELQDFPDYSSKHKAGRRPGASWR
jgi:hypothetical protein